MSLSEVFTNIYKNGTWGNGSVEKPFSGGGSNPDNSQPYVIFIRDFIISNKISSVTDIGHGDFKMWRDYQFDNVKYFGVIYAKAYQKNLLKNLEWLIKYSSIQMDFKNYLSGSFCYVKKYSST